MMINKQRLEICTLVPLSQPHLNFRKYPDPLEKMLFLRSGSLLQIVVMDKL